MEPLKATTDADERRQMAHVLRRWIVTQSLASSVGHVGSALSIADIMAALWGGAMHRVGTNDPDRDRFILGKGHAALALYAALRYCGLMDEATFTTFCADGSRLGVHPEHGLRGIEVSTGSLGQGLSVACGLALAFRRRRSPARVFVLMSDAECNEGQVWEAAMFAGHHGLSAVTAVLDWNGLQALGHTRDVIAIRSPATAWESFGWAACEVDGHDIEGVHAAAASASGGRPRVIVAHTVLGKGVPFMEDRLEWHYRNLTPELAERALRHLDGER
jgi:transketolase